MRKSYLLFLVSFLSITTLSQDIIGNWNFNFILPDTLEVGENLKPISDDDQMQINEDGTFSYELQEIELSEKGRWSLDTVNDLLTYYYTNKESLLLKKSPNYHEILNFNKTRTYKITLKDNQLILNENGTNYCFVKEGVHSTTIVTDSFSPS